MLHCNKYNRARIVLAAISLAVVAGGTPLRAQTAPWRSVDAVTGQIADVPSLEQLAKDFPDSASVRLRLLNAQLNAGSDGGGAKEALDLATRGYAFGENAEAVLKELMDPDYAAWFESATKVNRAAISRSTLLSTVPVEAHLVESVARDPKTGDLYATTVVARALYVKRGAAEWQRLDLEGAGSLFGIAYDTTGQLLWIASGNTDEMQGEKVHSALIGFDPATGQVARRLSANGMVALGDVAVGDGGTVYVADPEQGIIHYAGPADEGLRPLVGHGVFRSPQGMVAVPGKPLLIVSDYRYGLAAVDTRTGKATRVASAKPAMLDGIDGLWRRGKSLVGVQNGTSPMRIVRIDMSNDWLTVRKLTVLEQANPAWTEPVGGAISDDELVYVATGQWGTFGPGGAVREGKTPVPTEIRTLPVGD
jgi:hypothetical protein